MLSKYFWYQWIFGTIFYVIYTWVVYHMGINSETINHQKTVLAYKNEIIQLKTKQTNELLDTISIFNDTSTKLQNDLRSMKSTVKEIRTEYTKEIQQPMYSQCVISEEYFNYLNLKIDELNSKGTIEWTKPQN